MVWAAHPKGVAAGFTPDASMRRSGVPLVFIDASEPRPTERLNFRGGLSRG